MRSIYVVKMVADTQEARSVVVSSGIALISMLLHS